MTLEISQKTIDLQGIGNKMNLELAHHQENYEQNSFGLGTYKLTFVGLDHQGQFNDHHVCAKKNDITLKVHSWIIPVLFKNSKSSRG